MKIYCLHRYCRKAEIIGLLLIGILISRSVNAKTAFNPDARTQQVQKADIQSELVVKGQVVNEAGKPMPGVSVQVKETGTGVVTNDEGHYIITIPTQKARLVFMSVGYQPQEISVTGRDSINVVMEPLNTGLNEVVVIGYGTQKKISVTGAVSSMSVSDIQRTATPSLSNAIGGKMPGIITRQAIGEPGYDAAQVFIRGQSTWVNAAPLVLVNGVERDMNTINPSEIASFTILKDASATAVYGVRGANGVILIKTKEGVVGKPSILFRTERASLTPLRLPKYINSFEYASLMNEALLNEGSDKRWTDEDLTKFKDGSDPYLYPDVDWTSVIMKDHTSQTINNLSVTGGNQIARYFVNVGYTMEDGLYKTDDLNSYNTNTNLKRYNFRSNVGINLSKSLTINLDLGGIIQDRNYPGNSSWSVLDALTIVPALAYPVLNPDGSPGGAGTYIGQNPWGVLTQSGYEHQDFSTLQGTFNAKWDLSSLTKGLSVSGTFAYDRVNEAHDQHFKTFEVKRFNGKDPETGEDNYTIYRDGTPLGFGVVNVSNRSIYNEARINYETKLDKHSITGMILYNQRDYIDLTAASSILNIPYRQQGVAGRLSYDYDNRYLAEFDFGYNGSKNFPKGKKFGFFPSVSVGWILSNEKFWSVDFINSLKIRGSYGKVGNDQVGGSRFLFLSTAYQTGTTYPFGQNPIWYNGMGEQQTGDPNVTWETSMKSNLGMDLEMLEGKITLQADFFKENRKDILMQRAAVPGYVGLPGTSIPYGNIGKVENEGVDAMLEFKNKVKDRSDFYYSFKANFTYAHNTVLENDQPDPRFAYLSQQGYSIGQPFGLVAIGLFKDAEEIALSPVQTFKQNVMPGDIKYKDINGDGIIDVDDRVAIGYPRAPEMMFGFGGTVAWNGFDLSVYFTGTGNTSMFFDGTTMWAFQPGFGNMNVLSEYYDNRWTPDNKMAKYPGIHPGNDPNNYQESTLWQRDASYLRFQNAEIGYSLSDKVTEKLHISKTRFFINSTNLVTWDKIKIVSPEANEGSHAGYPQQRIINFGLQINFQ
ncbi:MAG TPA: TonB-dependent receptor [Arachidicoccus sp.]|nr:TonB-dependent receptor [Arachidicoccus sp.]